MTKEELRNMVNDAINERIEDAINAYKEGLNNAIKEKDWSRADAFENCIYDYTNARECTFFAVNKVFDKIEFVGDSPYKEVWKKLEDRLVQRKEEYEKKKQKYGENELYLSASINNCLGIGIGEAIKIMEELVKEKNDDKQ